MGGRSRRGEGSSGGVWRGDECRDNHMGPGDRGGAPEDTDMRLASPWPPLHQEPPPCGLPAAEASTVWRWRRLLLGFEQGAATFAPFGSFINV